MWFERTDDLHRPDLGRARHGAGGERRRQQAKGVLTGAQLAFDARDDMHDVAVALDLEQASGSDGARVADAGEVVACEIDEHLMLGALFGVCEQFVGEPIVLLGILTTGPRTSDRAQLGDAVARQRNVRLGRRANQRELAELDEKQIRGGVDGTERAVDRNGTPRCAAAVALREHDLEDVASGDVLLADLDPLDVLVDLEVGDRLAARH